MRVPTLSLGPQTRSFGYTTPYEVLPRNRFTEGDTSGVRLPSTPSGIPAWIIALGGAAIQNYLKCGKIICGGGGGGTFTDIPVKDVQCPPGWDLGPSGICEAPGSPGNYSTDTPSGVGPLGLFTAPIQVGEIHGNPILKCPAPHLVLARDNMCYDKRALPRKFRKWRPAAKALISAHDGRMMSKYGPGGSKQAAVGRVAKRAGFTCGFSPKGKPRGKGRKRK